MAETANDRFERMADAFYTATGFLAPGKDDPLATEANAANRTLMWSVFVAGYDCAARTPPAEDGPVVWLMRGYKRAALYVKGSSGPNDWIMLDGRIARLLDLLALTSGECRAFRLVPVTEGVTDA